MNSIQIVAQKPYGYEVEVEGGFEDALAKTKETFKAEGFGVLAEIDVQKTLKEKIGADMDRYLILGMCNPPLAHRAIEAEPTIGLLLPCNVVLRESGGKVFLSVQDPQALMGVVGNEALEPIGTEAGERIKKAVEAVLH